jgi:hypothetical protein
MIRFVAAIVISLFVSSAPSAQQAPSIVAKPIAEKKVTQLPSGPLFWRIENFETRGQAEAAAGSYGLVADSLGKVWLFTLGPQGQATPGATKITEIGPMPDVTASEYLLRVLEGSGAPGAVSTIHTHPGSEGYYVMKGEGSQKTPHGVGKAAAGQTLAGHGPSTVMQFISSGTTDVSYFALFVVDATKPFTVPAKFD